MSYIRVNIIWGTSSVQGKLDEMKYSYYILSVIAPAIMIEATWLARLKNFLFALISEEGIEPLLELEDVMAVDVPEPKSLITYVHFVYQHFSEKNNSNSKHRQVPLRLRFLILCFNLS